MLLMLG